TEVARAWTSTRRARWCAARRPASAMWRKAAPDRRARVRRTPSRRRRRCARARRLAAPATRLITATEVARAWMSTRRARWCAARRDRKRVVREEAAERGGRGRREPSRRRRGGGRGRLL